MPTITVCPKQPSFKSLIVNFFNKYHNFTWPKEFKMAFERLRISYNMDLTYGYYDATLFDPVKRKAPFSACLAPNLSENPKESCEIPKLLAMMQKSSTSCPSDEIDFLAQFLIENIGRRETLQLGDIERAFERECKVAIDLESSEFPDPDEVDWGNLATGYTLFFTLISKQTGRDEYGFVPLQPFENYGKQFEMERLGSFFGHVMTWFENRRFIDSEEREALDAVFKEMYKLLFDRVSEMAFGEIRDELQILDYFAYFDYDPTMSIFKRQFGEPVTTGCENITDTCGENSGRDLPPDPCLKYCEVIERSLALEGLVQELHEMADEGWDLNGLSKGPLLPYCNWDRPCWTKVVTDRGVCFTDYDKGATVF